MTFKYWYHGQEIEKEILDLKPERKYWCENNLASFFKSTRCGIKSIDYFYLEDHTEMLRVYYDEEKWCYKDVFITADSYAAIVKDMYIQRVVF